MHYIIGTQINITGKTIEKIRPGMTSQQIRQSSMGSTRFKKERSQFKLNRTYTLARIYKMYNETDVSKSKIAYEWSDGAGSRIRTEFDTVKLAEDFISEVKGETIPEYDNFSDRTD